MDQNHGGSQSYPFNVKKGCSPNNAACEGFFGRLKNELFYDRNWNHVSIESFISKLEEYMHWYNEDRIKMSLGGMSPLQYRRGLALSFHLCFFDSTSVIRLVPHSCRIS